MLDTALTCVLCLVVSEFLFSLKQNIIIIIIF